MQDADDRYFVRTRKLENGRSLFQLLKGVLLDSGKYETVGSAIVEAESCRFWTLINRAGYVWVESGYKRFWRLRPEIAGQIREPA